MSPSLPSLPTAEAALFGAIVPAGLFRVISILDAGVRTAAGDALVAAWFLVVAAGTAALATCRGHPIGALVSGAIGGVVAGFTAFAVLIGWGIVAFALPLMSVLAVVAGAWTSYEVRRARGVATEPARGTWRSRLAGIAAAALVGLGVLIAA